MRTITPSDPQCTAVWGRKFKGRTKEVMKERKNWRERGDGARKEGEGRERRRMRRKGKETEMKNSRRTSKEIREVDGIRKGQGRERKKRERKKLRERNVSIIGEEKGSNNGKEVALGSEIYILIILF
jgi:hypothetical protein